LPEKARNRSGTLRVRNQPEALLYNIHAILRILANRKLVEWGEKKTKTKHKPTEYSISLDPAESHSVFPSTSPNLPWDFPLP